MGQNASACSLADLLEASARRVPGRTAVVDPAGWSLTYRELDERAGRVAAFLLDHGVRPGDRVGVVARKGADAVTALFGIMKARAAYVPADFSAPAERNRGILADCSVTAVFVDAEAAGLVEGWDGDIPVVLIGDAGTATPRVHSFAAVLSHPERSLPDGRDLDDLSYVLYTSGSTGVPKGVILSHRNALAFVDWCSSVFRPVEDDRFSSHAPFHFDLSVLDLYVPLKHGAELHLVGEEVGKNPRELARLIAERRLTVWYSTPSILRLLAEFGDLPSHDCRALRLVLFAGEVFPVKHLRHLTRLWPWAAYYNLYGPTETNVCTFAGIPLPVPDERTVPYPIGWPCGHYRDLVLDTDGHPVTPGSEGLLFMAGPGVFQGYWNRPDENARAFQERDGERWYNTGDVVQLDSDHGYIYLGRRDRMVKRHGYRIELGEIERTLYQHPQVAEAAVVAASDSAGVRITAYLTFPDAARPSIIALKTFCGRHLPSYMSPDAFIWMDALPRTSTNKVDYQGLSRDPRSLPVKAS